MSLHLLEPLTELCTCPSPPHPCQACREAVHMPMST